MDEAASSRTTKIERASAEPAPACILVIFGATGDLTHRLLAPALYNLARWKLLPEDFAIVAVGRTGQDSDAFRNGLTAAVIKYTQSRSVASASEPFDAAAWSRVADRLDYLRGDLEDPQTYKALADRIAGSRIGQGGQGGVLFYLATAPALFEIIVRNLGASELLRQVGSAWRRVIIEKPFGHDLGSAQALNRAILKVVNEDQIYRIDHFLGKETVQNIMAFRFGNSFFEPIWNRDHIDHVQITVAETVGVEKRGRFYERIGALRDMVPNHLFQLFTLTAMEPPSSFGADAVRNRKQDVLTATRALSHDEVLAATVRAQYVSGTIHGEARRAYRDEPDVDPSSATETFAALRLSVDNWRWAGVPFFLRTGKAMSRRKTEIAIRFKQAPLSLFRGTAVSECIPNWLVMQIQPEEGISLHLGAKIPGPVVQLSPVDMSFSYADHFQIQASTGYETLVYDAMVGDATLYQRADNIEAGWSIVQPILDVWENGGTPMASYPAGSAGPEEAEQLIASLRCRWRPL